MKKQDAIEKAKSLFAKDELLGKLHFTSDGQAFPIENRAQVHQKEIGDKAEAIITVKREDVEEVITVKVDNGNDEPTTEDHEVTQEDLDANPELVENGVSVGDIIQIPVKE